MKEFEYASTTTVEDAVQLLAAHGDQATVLAGGTDILVQLREGQREAELVVDIKKIPLLGEISFDPVDGLRLGAAVSCCDIYDHPDVATAYPGLVDAARIIGGWQIQSRACIGGNLCNSSPAADGIPPLIVYDVTGFTLAGPVDLNLDVYGSGLVKLSSASAAPGQGKSEIAHLTPQQTLALARALFFAGSFQTCDQPAAGSDVPLHTLTVFRGATDAKAHTFSWWVPEKEYATFEQLLDGFIATHFPGF